MKTSFTQQEIKITFCTVSSSILLCSSMEVQASPAEEETTPWYRQDIPVLTLPTLATTYAGHLSANPDIRSTFLTTEDATPYAWDHVYGEASRQAQADALAQGVSTLASDELKRPGDPDPAKRQRPYPAGRPDRRHQPDPGQQQWPADQSRHV
jgi:hypothetical protein